LRFASLPVESTIMIRFAVSLIIGLAILAAVFWTLGNLRFNALVIAFALHIILAGLNIVWIAVIAGMMILGWSLGLRGLLAAPPAFFAIWFGAAVVDRYHAARETDPTLSVRAVPSELRDIRTVTLVSRGVRCCGQITLLAGGLVDRYVEAHDDDKGHIGPILVSELTNKDCTSEELRQSELLQHAGRIGECVRKSTIDAIPDGLVVRMQPRPMVPCCTAGTVGIRQNGEERVATTWHSGRQTVLAYLPLFGLPATMSPTASLWAASGGGPYQTVWIGGPDFYGEDLVAAAYGTSWDAPPKPVNVGTDELIRRAEEIARGPNRTAALDVALAVQAKGAVNDDVLSVVASTIELSSILSPAYQGIQKFWFKLSPGQQRRFIELIMARMQDPAVGADYNRAELPFHWDHTNYADFADQAQRVFEERRDLRTWQYELALRLAANDKLWMKSTDYFAEQHQRFLSIRDDTSDAFLRRALAFKRVYFLSSDEEREFFAQHFDRVPDNLLRDYLNAAGWNRNIQDEPSVTAATGLLRQQAAARMAAVQDVALRRDLQEWFRPDRN
jgi:hypothetical protein